MVCRRRKRGLAGSAPVPVMVRLRSSARATRNGAVGTGNGEKTKSTCKSWLGQQDCACETVPTQVHRAGRVPEPGRAAPVPERLCPIPEALAPCASGAPVRLANPPGPRDTL